MSYPCELDRIRDDLPTRFSGRQIWYVPHSDRTVKWCARPDPLINSNSPERLAFDIHPTHAARWPALPSWIPAPDDAVSP
jgi:hypothetical protein